MVGTSAQCFEVYMLSMYRFEIRLLLYIDFGYHLLFRQMKRIDFDFFSFGAQTNLQQVVIHFLSVFPRTTLFDHFLEHFRIDHHTLRDFLNVDL